MPIKDITAYRVFIASPGGLEKERRAFRQALLLYNETDAIHDGVMFIPVGWEDTLGGVGRPQSIINDDLRKCDFAIVLLHNRWGSAPDRDVGRYSSGTEEEFHVAMECQRDETHPMRQVVTFFKAVAPKYLVEPSEQLTKVLEFRKRLEREKEHLFHVFDTTRSFEDLLRRHFGAWLRSIRRGGGLRAWPEPEDVASLIGEQEPANVEVSPSSPGRDMLRDAWRLADDGRRTEAEALFARAIVPPRDPEALVDYGRFLLREGRLAQAEAMLDLARDLSEREANPTALARAFRWTAYLHLLRSEYGPAEAMYGEALRLSRAHGDEREVAASFNGLGLVFRARNELDEAERMVRESLEITGRLGDLEGTATSRGNLGNILWLKGDLAGAERMHLDAIETFELLGSKEGLARSIGNLAIVLIKRGDLDAAERTCRRAMEISAQLGYQKGVAVCSRNLGLIEEKRCDAVGARTHFERALELYRQVGNSVEVQRLETDLARLGAEDARSAS